jgi:hypothetical protein
METAPLSMGGGPHPEKKHTSAFFIPGCKHALERETRHHKGIQTGRRTSRWYSGSPRGGHLCVFRGETGKDGWAKSLEVFLYGVLYGWLGDFFYEAPYGCLSGENPLRTLLTLRRESTQHTFQSSAGWVSTVPREGLSSLPMGRFQRSGGCFGGCVVSLCRDPATTPPLRLFPECCSGRGPPKNERETLAWRGPLWDRPIPLQHLERACTHCSGSVCDTPPSLRIHEQTLSTSFQYHVFVTRIPFQTHTRRDS